MRARYLSICSTALAPDLAQLLACNILSVNIAWINGPATVHRDPMLALNITSYPSQVSVPPASLAQHSCSCSTRLRWFILRGDGALVMAQPLLHSHAYCIPGSFNPIMWNCLVQADPGSFRILAQLELIPLSANVEGSRKKTASFTVVCMTVLTLEFL